MKDIPDLSRSGNEDGIVFEGGNKVQQYVDGDMNYDPVYEDESFDHNSDINEDDNADNDYSEGNVEIVNK